jgi:ankyrin repeat protein
MVDGIEPWATPLHIAPTEGNLVELSRLFHLSLEDLNTHDENNTTPLSSHLHSKYDISAVELLLCYSADLIFQGTDNYGE